MADNQDGAFAHPGSQTQQAQILDNAEDEFEIDVSGLLEYIVALETTLWAQECEINSLISLLRFQCRNIQRLNRQNQMLQGFSNGRPSTDSPYSAVADSDASI